MLLSNAIQHLQFSSIKSEAYDSQRLEVGQAQIARMQFGDVGNVIVQKPVLFPETGPSPLSRKSSPCSPVAQSLPRLSRRRHRKVSSGVPSGTTSLTKSFCTGR
jgi:hypothetical protein